MKKIIILLVAILVLQVLYTNVQMQRQAVLIRRKLCLKRKF